MKLKFSSTGALVVALFIVSAIAAVVMGRRVPPQLTAPRSAAQVREAYAQLPLSFEDNRGQPDHAIDFVARGPGYAVALSSTETMFALRKADNAETPAAVLRMNLVDANRDARAAGQEELEGRVNYLIGNEPAKWRTQIPTFGRVRYAEVYPGIDVVYYGNQRRLEYDFVVAPGRDARAIALEFSGADKVEVEAKTGDLLIGVGGENIRQCKPLVYQELNGERREIDGRYAIRSDGRVGFELGNYDASAALIIDPVLEYSTFFGGNGAQVRAIAVDAAGNAYLTGLTGSADFPTVNAVQNFGGTEDVFVSKLNASGSALIYSTYLGGGSNDYGQGIAVDSTGSAYVTGWTFSPNFPTVNAFQASKGSLFTDDAFVAKLNPAGSALVYSTFLGGGNNDHGNAIAVDSAGNAYVTGWTFSSDFPIANALQSTYGGRSCELGDAFVTKFNAAGSLIYSTFLGGNRDDEGRGIAVDSTGNAYVTGITKSTNFPTANAFQSAYGDGSYDGGCDFGGDAFVTKINAAGSAFVYSTYLGGSGGDLANGIAVDSAGNAYVTGGTDSTNFPTANALQGALKGTSNVFVTKFNPAGSALVYSTYLGGDNGESGIGIAVDATGSAYVTGFTQSTNFPTVNSFKSTLDQRDFLGDAFVAKFNAAGSALIYSTYLGGNNTEMPFGIAIDPAGSAYVAGSTGSRCFPTTVGAFDTTFSSGTETGFVSKISETAQPSALTPCPAQLINLAARMRVLPGDSALIGGFIITSNGVPDTATKRVIIRGIGPSLTGVPGALANPTLQLFKDNQLIASNDDWITNRAEVEQTGIPPTNDRESAIVATLYRGNYTAVLRGQNNSSGIGVVEVYDLDPEANTLLVNLGSRGFVDTGDNVMIGGFIIGPQQADRRVVVRGLGPSLSAYGVTGALQDPIIDLKNANGTTILSNDDWQQGQPTEINKLHLAPSDSRESALVATLARGNYTAILRGKGNATGIGVVEVYNVD